MTLVVGEMEITNDVRLAPNSTVRDGLVEIDDDLAIRVGSFYYDFGTSKGKYPGVLNQAVTDNATNYVSLDTAGALVLNPSAYPTSAHIRLARVITSGGLILRIVLERAFLGSSASVSSVSSASGQFTVPSAASVNDLVYSTGAFTADRADNSATTTAPGIGIVTAKPSSTTATLAYSGVVGGFTGLTPGADLFIGTLGAIIEAGALPTTPGSVVQKIGIAIDTTTLLLNPANLVVL
jgi:hypothetical protein